MRRAMARMCWVLVATLAVHAIVGPVGGLAVLCLGCGEGGLSLGRGCEAVVQIDDCCGHEGAPRADALEPCDCTDILLQSAEILAATDARRSGPGPEMPAPAWEALLTMDVHGPAIATRIAGPPDTPARALSTPLALRTVLRL